MHRVMTIIAERSSRLREVLSFSAASMSTPSAWLVGAVADLPLAAAAFGASIGGVDLS
jgi:hypothetical protein